MVRLRPAIWKMRRLIIATEPNVMAMARMWMVWIVGITQKFRSISMLSGCFWIHSESSVSGVVRSH